MLYSNPQFEVMPGSPMFRNKHKSVKFLLLRQSTPGLGDLSMGNSQLIFLKKSSVQAECKRKE